MSDKFTKERYAAFMNEYAQWCDHIDRTREWIRKHINNDAKEPHTRSIGYLFDHEDINVVKRFYDYEKLEIYTEPLNMGLDVLFSKKPLTDMLRKKLGLPKT